MNGTINSWNDTAPYTVTILGQDGVMYNGVYPPENQHPGYNLLNVTFTPDGTTAEDVQVDMSPSNKNRPPEQQMQGKIIGASLPSTIIIMGEDGCTYYGAYPDPDSVVGLMATFVVYPGIPTVDVRDITTPPSTAKSLGPNVGQAKKTRPKHK